MYSVYYVYMCVCLFVSVSGYLFDGVCASEGVRVCLCAVDAYMTCCFPVQPFAKTGVKAFKFKWSHVHKYGN